MRREPVFFTRDADPYHLVVPMQRARLVPHKGTQILLQDFSRVQSVDESLRHIDEARAFMQQQPKGGVLLVTDVTGSAFDRRVLAAMQELAEHNKPYVAAAAIVGLSPLARVAHAAISRLTGRTIRAFDSLDAAKDWLVEQPVALDAGGRGARGAPAFAPR